MPPLIHPGLVVAAVLASIAAITDLRTRRIPNWLTASGLCIGLIGNLVVGALHDGAPGLLTGAQMSLLGAAIGFALLFPLYVVRPAGLGHAMGAGDVKLLAAVGAIVGPYAVVSVAVYGLMVGALQSASILLRRGRFGILLHQTVVMHGLPMLSGAKAPYAVALAAGVYLAIVLPPVLRS